MDQVKFADAVGVASRNTISAWERGMNYPPADILALIHGKFGISVEWIVMGKGEMKYRQGPWVSLSEPSTVGELQEPREAPHH